LRILPVGGGIPPCRLVLRPSLKSEAIFFRRGKIAALFHFARCAADVPAYRDTRARCPCHV